MERGVITQNSLRNRFMYSCIIVQLISQSKTSMQNFQQATTIYIYIFLCVILSFRRVDIRVGTTLLAEAEGRPDKSLQ